MTHQTVGDFDPSKAGREGALPIPTASFRLSAFGPPKAGCKPTLRGGGRIAPIKVGESQVPAAQLVELIALVETKTISNSAAQPVFAEMFESGKAPAAIVQEKGLAKVSDKGAIEEIADEVIAANPGPAADFKAGKVAALNFHKGQVMKLPKGKANPGVAGEILEKKLKA